MLVGAVGYNYRHRKDFIMDCPQGVGCPLILLIKEPSVFVINGIEHRAEKNSFILLSPDIYNRRTIRSRSRNRGGFP